MELTTADTLSTDSESESLLEEVLSRFHCLKHGCKNSLANERMLRCKEPDCREVFCVRCFEQLIPEIGKEEHEYAFICEGGDNDECGAEAAWECQEEGIAYCDNCFKNEHKGRRKSHSKVPLPCKKLRTDTQEVFNVIDFQIVKEVRHELLVADEDNQWVHVCAENWQNFKLRSIEDYCPIVSFIGSTGTGKSFLVQSFTGEEEGPRVAPLGQKGSTSANIHLYHAPGFDGAHHAFEKILLLDCEGDGGTMPEMLQSRWLPLQKINMMAKRKLHLSCSPNRTHIVKEEFPRLMYLLSDVVVFLETVEMTRIQDYLAKFQKFIDATQKGIFSADTPSLLIIQNKVDPAAVNNRLSVSEATEDFLSMAFPFANFYGKSRRKKSQEGLDRDDDMPEEMAGQRASPPPSPLLGRSSSGCGEPLPVSPLRNSSNSNSSPPPTSNSTKSLRGKRHSRKSRRNKSRDHRTHKTRSRKKKSRKSSSQATSPESDTAPEVEESTEGQVKEDENESPTPMFTRASSYTTPPRSFVAQEQDERRGSWSSSPIEVDDTTLENEGSELLDDEV